MKNKVLPLFFALFAAVFYALGIPLSKLLLSTVAPTMMAGLLYSGAGIGVGVLFAFNSKHIPKKELLDKSDFPFVVAMIVLDIAAPILLMFGIKYSTSANSSLLNNFEIVATSIIAVTFFKEKLSPLGVLAVVAVTIASVTLTFDFSALKFSWGSLLVLGATVCWGVENNCTRRLSEKSSYEIVTVKGLCCGAASVIIALVVGEGFPPLVFVLYALALGFVAYGLSIFFYVKAQRTLGASKTSAFYAVNPLIAVLLSFIVLGETPQIGFYISLAVMTVGIVLIIVDTLKPKKQTELKENI